MEIFSILFTCLFCGIYIAAIGLGLASFILWIVMLIDVVQRDKDDFGPDATNDTRMIWLLLVILTGGIGSLVYYFIIYKKYPRAKKVI